MKRAEVNAGDAAADGSTLWYVHVYSEPVGRMDRRRPIAGRKSSPHCREYPTHAEALEAAIVAVGLAPGNPEPMEAP